MNKLKEQIENITLDGDDKSGWYTVESGSVSFNRDEVLLEEFNKHHGTNITNVNDIYELVSMSDDIQEWYLEFNINYNESSNLPKYVDDVLDSKEYVEVRKKLSDYKKLQADVQNEINKESQIYKDKISKIRERIVNTDIGKDDPIFKILNLNVKQLPLNISLKIINYTPSTTNVAASRKMFAKEMLIRYKKNLLTAVKENKDLNISDLIEINKHLK